MYLKFGNVVTGPPLHETIKLLSPLTKLVELDLSFNKLGGAITADLAVFSNLKVLGLSYMGLDGKICMFGHRNYMRRMLCSHFHFFAGELPKELGQLTNLTCFDVSNNAQYEKDEDGDDVYNYTVPDTGFTGELYVPAYMRCIFADISTFFHRGVAEGARQPYQFERPPTVQQSIARQVVCSSIHALYVC